MRTFSWISFKSRVTKSQPYPNEERTSLWKATAQWTKHWIMGKTTLDWKFGARSVARFQAWRLHFIECGYWRKPLSTAFQRFSNVLQNYKTVFDVRKFPVISQAINIDKDLRAKLQINGIPVPLLKWFVEGRSAKLVKIPILGLFPHLSQQWSWKISTQNSWITLKETVLLQITGTTSLVLYKYGAMLFCWDKRLHRVIAVGMSYLLCLQFLSLLNCIMVVQAHWKLSKNY